MGDLIHQRVKQIEVSKKECPEDLLESVCTLLYCAKRVDIPELSEVGGQFKAKWGDKWFNKHIENKSGRVSKQIIEKLSPQPPKRSAVDAKMKEIAKKYDLDWEPTDAANEEDMPAIVGHRNEYTVEFDSKPFGMEWTATENGSNLWVSNVTPLSQAARSGVVPGSMLIALNGIDIQNLGAPSIHDKASSLGLPLRVTFRKPESLEAPKNKKDFKIREDVVNNCVKQLNLPQSLDMDEQQKKAMCKKMGANAAEIASAIFLANYTTEMQNKQQPVQQQVIYQQAPQYVSVQPIQQMPMNGQMVYPSPMQQQQQGPMNGNIPLAAYGQVPPQQQQQQQGYIQPHDTPQNPPPQQQQQPPQEPPSGNDGDGGLDDLEARFAALKNGL